MMRVPVHQPLPECPRTENEKADADQQEVETERSENLRLRSRKDHVVFLPFYLLFELLNGSTLLDHRQTLWTQAEEFLYRVI
jgi:hypothetical protein